MGEWAARFGDDGDGIVEERSPSRIRGARDEDGAFGEGGEVVDAADKIDGTLCLTGAAGEAGKAVTGNW